MRLNERGLGWRLMASAGATLLALLVGWPAPGEASHTIKIGIAGPMTGGDAKMGQDFERAGRLVLEERKGQVAGHKIEFLVEDDKADPKEAIAVANKLVNAGVTAAIGHYNSSCSIPASDIYNEASIVQITPTSSNPKFTKRGYKMLYRVITRDYQQGVFVADYLKNQVKAQRVAIIHDKTTYGQGLAEETRNAMEKLGMKPIFFEAITRGEKDFTPVVTKLKATNPDYTYFTGYYAEGGILVRQFRDLGVPGMFFAGRQPGRDLHRDRWEGGRGRHHEQRAAARAGTGGGRVREEVHRQARPEPRSLRPLRLRRVQPPVPGDGAGGGGNRQSQGRERRAQEDQELPGGVRDPLVQREG